MSGPAGAWIRGGGRIHEPAARLLCLPPAGGSAGAYRGWQRAADDDDIEVLAVQPPGRGPRHGEPSCATIDELVDAIVGALDPWLDRPLALFGHSMGALVAFELALRLEHGCGIRPALLAVAAASPPQADARGHAHAALEDDDLVERLWAAGGLPEHVLAHPDLLALVLPAIRVDLGAVARYRPSGSSRVSCPILTFAAVDDPLATPAGMRGWSATTTGPAAAREFDGGHHFVARHGEAVLRELRSAVHAHVATAGTPHRVSEALSFTMMLGGAQTDGALALAETTLAADHAGPPLHRHRDTHDIFYILEGTLTLLLDGEERRLGPGGLACVAPGVAHTFRNDGDRPARFLNITTPSGQEHLVEALATAARSAPLDAEGTAAVAAPFDVELILPAR